MKEVQPGSRRTPLVDPTEGIVSREIFVSEEIYQQEQERIFARAWLFIGHETQIPKPGDYFVSRMGEESVILCRDRQDQIHVLLNSCRHRGMKVCRYDEGNTPVFTCPYHGWSYAPDGRLVGVPYFKEAYHGKLDKSKWGLVEVAQMTNYKGGIWATWDPEAPPFLDYVGDFRFYLDILLDSSDGADGGAEVFGGVQKWTIPCNWKFPSENFVGDLYHGVSHRSVDAAAIGPSGKGRRDNEVVGARRVSVAVPTRGHGVLPIVRYDEATWIPTYQQNPVVEEYFKHVHEERQRRLGQMARILGSPGTLFPNMSFLSRQPRSIGVWHPHGPHQTEAWRWFLIDKQAPQEVRDLLRHYYIRYSGPGGLTEQDDMENWNYASAASRGTIARRFPYNYEMGLGVTDFVEGVPGEGVEGMSEQNQRGFYREWAGLMEGRSWAELTQ